MSKEIGCGGFNIGNGLNIDSINNKEVLSSAKIVSVAPATETIPHAEAMEIFEAIENGTQVVLHVGGEDYYTVYPLTYSEINKEEYEWDAYFNTLKYYPQQESIEMSTCNIQVVGEQNGTVSFGGGSIDITPAD